MKEKIDHKAFTAHLFEEGIVRMDIKAVENLTADDVQKMYDTYLKLGNGKKVRILATCNKYIPLSKEAMQYAKANSGKYISATAMVISNNVNRIGIKFFMNFYKPKHPFGVFSNTNEATKWLHSLS